MQRVFNFFKPVQGYHQGEQHTGDRGMDSWIENEVPEQYAQYDVYNAKRRFDSI